MYKCGPESICIPPPVEWTRLVERNKKALASGGHPLASLRARFRSELYEAAVAFERQVAAVAKSAGIQWQTPPSFDLNLGVVMTGHQPVIYHCGLAEKTKLLAATVGSQKLLGFNIIIDTDAGDAGEIVFPTQTGILETLSISQGGELLANQALQGEAAITSAFERIAGELTALAQPAASKRVQEAADLYIRLAGTQAVLANSLARRLWEGPQSYLEVPLSAVVTLPTTRAFIAALVADGVQFHHQYNRALETHRANHKIKNVANPFPNLKSDGERYELPLWRLSGLQSSRLPYFSSPQDSDYSTNDLLSPRGALITTMLRFLGADLFIHGLGGATYEPVTDLLLSEYFAVPGTEYVTASANRYLFTSEIAEHEETLACAEAIRNIPTRIPKFLNQGIFSLEQEVQLESLHHRRISLVAALKKGKEERTDVRQIGVALKDLDAEIKALLATSALAQRAKVPPVSLTQLSQWYCRSFPHFFFASTR